jgi:O-antigen/teichoic acid export membrane protein
VKFRKIKDTQLRELLEGSSATFILMTAGMLLGYVFILMLTRTYGAEVMGLLALSITVLSIVSVVGRLGFDTALIRFVADYSSSGRRESVKEVYVKALKMALPFCLLLSAVLFFSAPYLAEHVFDGKEYLSGYFRIASVAVLPMVLKFLNAGSLRGLKRIKEFSFIQNTAVFLFASVLLGFSLLFVRDVHVPVIVYVTSIALVSVLSVYLWLNGSGLSAVRSSDSIGHRAMLGVSFPMLLSSSMFLIMQWTDTVMLGMFRTEAEVGIYNVALRVAALTSVSLIAVNSIAAPKFAEFYGNGDMKGLENTVRHSTKLIFWSSLPVLVALFFFPSLILGIFGSEFRAGVYALLMLAAGQFVNAFSGSVGFILQMSGRQKAFQNIILTAAAINIALNAALIPRYGINGAAFASMVSMAFWNIVAVCYISRNLGIKTYYAPVLGWARRF